jgi:DNA polymerase I
VIVVFDTETNRFAPGCMAPPLVCVQWLTVDVGRCSAPQIINHWRGSEWARWALKQDLIVGQNVSYDLAVLCAQDESLVPLVYRAYEENRVTDTMLRQKLADIGRGKYRGFFNGDAWIQLNYDLGAICKRHGGHANKEDPWRLHYGLLRDVPVERWGEQICTNVPCVEGKGKKARIVLRELKGSDALSYALNDPVATAQAFLGQATRYDPALLVNEFDQARHFWALDLASTWGIRTSPAGVESLRAGAQERLDHLAAFLGEHELVRPNGSRNTTLAAKRMLEVCKAEGLQVRRTKAWIEAQRTGKVLGLYKGVCLDSEACNSVQDPVLEAYSEYSSMMKVLSNDVEMLRRGIGRPIHTNFGTAESGRKTSASPNIQNPRRLPGVRECFVPTWFGTYSEAHQPSLLDLAFADEDDEAA